MDDRGKRDKVVNFFKVVKIINIVFQMLLTSEIDDQERSYDIKH